MSKKKAAGSTMTLKDFHGGSIPSDLPLPSAPGVIPKSTTDRPVYDRAPWGTSIGRPDQRTRPSSSHSIRTFDDKSLFLPHTANIGRNFSEDERKPLDGHSGPRRMVSDDVFRVANSRLEVKADSVLTGRHSGWSAPAGPFPGKMTDVTHSVTGAGNCESSVSGTHSNVWTARKEVPVAANNEPGHSPWTTQPAVSNLVHTNALEPSVRWQSKLLGPSQMGLDAVKHSEIESRGYKTNSPVLSQRNEPHVSHVERGLIAEDAIQGGRKFSREYEKVPGPTYLDVKEARVVANNSNKPLLNYSDVRPVGHLVQPTTPSEVVERPKLNLLPRTKPFESIEKPVNDGKLENGASNLIQRETVYATQKSMNISKHGSSADEISNQPAERPKVYLKSVAQLLEQPEVKPEKERNAVFGGARPRELVLKERGIDETEHHKLEQPLDRTVLKPIERVPEHANQRPLSSPRDLRTRKFDQKDGRSVSDINRSETQRRNWRDNDIKSTRQQQHQTQEKTRHPSPETWRKPVAEKPQSPDGTGLRHGKAASPLELAQAYSDSKSGTGSSKFNMSRNNQTQQPFSRLVGSTTTPRQINGY
uniref:Eukaryotic translation initiation factor-related n=1 Tax=Noccaea caerulescens TaxID=107243 RepID=A0A1J3GLX7_NOCCA